MKKVARIFVFFLMLVFIFPVGALLYINAQGFYQTRNMRLLAKQIEATNWQDYSYNIYSDSVSQGFYKGEIWGPNGTYLNLSIMHLEDELEENIFDQINDIRVCINGYVKFVDFVESQTGKKDLTFKEALLFMDEAYEHYRVRLELGQSPELPREHYNNNYDDCESVQDVAIPERVEKNIRY